MITFPSAPNRTVYPLGNSVCTIASTLMDDPFPCVVRIRRTAPRHPARLDGGEMGPDGFCRRLNGSAGDPPLWASHPSLPPHLTRQERSRRSAPGLGRHSGACRTAESDVQFLVR